MTYVRAKRDDHVQQTGGTGVGTCTETVAARRRQRGGRASGAGRGCEPERPNGRARGREDGPTHDDGKANQTKDRAPVLMVLQDTGLTAAIH